ncbi:MAG: hypothetical protein K8F92_21125, partial [Hyphomicrobium sp.]|nr:hypothetical protein [Hyphomicrobium sp.]
MAGALTGAGRASTSTSAPVVGITTGTIAVGTDSEGHPQLGAAGALSLWRLALQRALDLSAARDARRAGRGGDPG